MRPLFTSALLAASATALAAPRSEWPAPVAENVAVVKSIGPEGKNGPQAARAARDLAERLPPAAVPRLLGEMSGANPLAANLLRAAVESIADRADGREPLPNADLEAFARETKNDRRARRLAYELALRSDSSVTGRLIPNMLGDPSPEFGRDAVAYHVAQADRLKAAGKADEAKAAYEKALTGAIYDDQVRTIATALKEYGVEVDVPRHFGFVREWKIIGPFDNTGMKGFTAVYPPESEVDFDATYPGKLGEVRWQPISTDDDYGEIDVAKQVENYKGSAMYLAAEFDSPREQAVEVRLGTPNAWKLWVNGEFLFGREEYHRGMEMDQYRVPAALKPGRNILLFKILQNEQSEDWAQSYKFRLRVCDPAGRAVLPASP